MSMKANIIGCLAVLVTLGAALEEHPHFCIKTDPILLSEIDRHVVIPSEEDLQCHIRATTLTQNEKASLVDTLCADHGSTTIRRDNHSFLRLRNGELTGRGGQADVCANGGDSVLAWVPYQTVLQNYAAELNPKERLTYIAKATNVEREKTELCHFRHTDLVNAVSDNLFTCVVMIFGDNFMHLGESVLRNPSGERKPIYGSLNYAFVEKILMNMSSVYKNKKLSRLPLLFEHRSSVLELDSYGMGGLDVAEKAFIRIDNTEPVFMDPESSNLAKASLFREQKVGQIKEDPLGNFTEWESAQEEDFDEDGPGFYCWFVVTCLLLALAIILAIYILVSAQNRRNKKRHMYEVANTNVPPPA